MSHGSVRPGAGTAVAVAVAAGLALGFGAAHAQSFGGAVAIAGEALIVGEVGTERSPGTAYLYRRAADGTWVARERITAPEPRDRDGFGRSLAADDSTLIVAAVGAGPDAPGVVHVFRPEPGGGWRAVARLEPASSPADASFGREMALAGMHALVGAPGEASGTGSVHAFARGPSSGAWTAGERLTPVDPAAGDQFGSAIALRGDLAVVGAPAKDEVGAAYVFRYAQGVGWRQLARLTPASEPSRGRPGFGSAVAFAGGEILVGAPGAGGFSGVVYRFGGDSEAGWSEVGRIEPAARGTGFGASLIARGDELWIGAAGGRGDPRIHVYRRAGDEWFALSTLGDVGTGEGFGAAAALGDTVAVVGAPGDDFGAGTAVVFVRGPDGWTEIQQIWSDQVGLPAITGGQVDCEDRAADLYDCEEVDLVAFLPREQLGAGRGARLNDVWGWTDPETGREYAIVGRMDGTAFVDVTDPLAPVYLGNLAPTAGSVPSTWRDMKVYRDHAFIVADGAGEHGMQVFDLRRLRDVGEPPVELEATARYDGIASAHNLAINEATGFAYVVGASGGGESCGGGLHMIDLREPTEPAFAGCFAHEGTGRRGTGYTHDAQCVVYHGPDEEHLGREICIGANETALSIADVTDKASPVPLSTAAYPAVGYTHQGWLTEDHRYFFSNDELDELSGLVETTRTLVWDVTDLDDPTLVREYFSPTRVTDHNLYVRGDRLYMSNNRSGLRVVDVSDPENPVEIGHFDTTPWSEDAAGFDGTWSVYPFFESGTILLSSRREGLFLVKPRERRLVP